MTKKTIQILLFEDNPGDVRLLREFLNEDRLVQVGLDHVERLETGLKHLIQGRPDVILLDLGLPDSQGLETFTHVYAQAQDVPIVVLTGLIDTGQAVEAVRTGAQDYLVKGEVSSGLLVRAIHYAIERKQVEEALRRERDFAEGMIETAQTIVLVLDTQGRIVRFNPYMEEASGYALSEVQGLDWFTTFLPERDREPIHNLFLKALGGIQTLGNVNPIVTKDGREREIQWYDKTLKDAQGNVVGLLSTGQDITEDKRAEEQLRYQAAVLANMNDAVVASDAQFRLTSWNLAAESLYGWKAGEVLGRNGLEVTHTEWPGVEAEVMRRRIDEAGRWRGEATQARRDGTRFPVEVSSIVFRDESGQITGYVSVNHDVTERKRSEEALRESEQKYRRLVDNASEAIVVAQDGILKFANRMASDLTGYSEQELTSRPFSEFVHPDDRGMVIERYLRRIKGDVDQPRYVFRLKVRDGSNKWVEINAVLIDWEGKPATLNFLNDVTERRQAEEALRKSEEQLLAILDATPFPIALVDEQDNNIDFWSRSALTLFGHTAPTTPEWYQIAYPDPDYRREVIDRWKPFLEKARKSAQAVNTGEYRVTCRDGSVRICELYAAFLAGRLVVTFDDITESKRTREALRENEQRLSSIYESVGDVIYYLAAEAEGQYRFISVNPSFYRVTGLSQDQIVGKPVTEVIPEPSLSMVLGRYRQAIETKTIVRWEETSDYPAGRLTGEVSIAPVFDDEGRCTHLVGSVHDITERKKAEDKLLESEDKFKYVFDYSVVGKSITLLSGEIQVNNAFCEMLGYSSE